ncbi:hypothetical protein ANCDUO_07825 [Ancylostoma duodenale]|uniref:Reverse transcriptase RNase H-like domain-containing protein n=1 Tax=Ancylostoma duodenale TaxID=51022 RepID=A0A0C2DHI2_9BILA|nr:hypothetical protein ANCDUO_07825 [Ancylostoma duodenale]
MCKYIQKEGFALTSALQKFHEMLHGRGFTLPMDHKPFLAIFGSKNGIPVYTANSKEARALAYNFNILCRSTTSFGQADTLSTLTATRPTAVEDQIFAATSVDVDIQHIHR